MLPIIADYATVTVPVGAGPDLRDALTDVCLRTEESQTDPLGVRVGRFGLLRFQEQHGVMIASASGFMLAALRAANLLHEYCSAIDWCGPHRVTQIHAAKDVETDAPAELQRLYGLLRIAGIKLTRKRIQPRQVKSIFSPGEDGRDTGSIMCGHRARHETTMCIYDRANDARDKGKPDPGPLLRYELRTGVDGLTLRDIVVPAPLFYHFAAALFPRPDDVPPWQPHGEGFVMHREAVEDQVKLRRLVERSTDLGRMIDLAESLPGEGLDVLLHLVRRRAKVRHNTRAFGGASGARSAEGDSPSPPAAPSPGTPDDEHQGS